MSMIGRPPGGAIWPSHLEHLGELPLAALEDPDEVNQFKTDSEQTVPWEFRFALFQRYQG